MNLTAQALIDSPVGKIAVFNTEQQLTGIDIYNGDINYKAQPKGELTHILVEQINQYFNKELKEFNVPIQYAGTDFQNKVWQALFNIPYGECWTYGELANVLQTSPRAIGGACRHNPIPLIVPCHRIIAATGIGGYSGQWQNGSKVDTKVWLLQHEKGNQ